MGVRNGGVANQGRGYVGSVPPAQPPPTPTLSGAVTQHEERIAALEQRVNTLADEMTTLRERLGM